MCIGQGRGMAERHHVTYRGELMGARRLVGDLRDEGFEVDWTPPPEQRDLGGIGDPVTVSIIVAGFTAGPAVRAASARAGADAYEAIKRVVSRWRERGADIDWREEDGYR